MRLPSFAEVDWDALARILIPVFFFIVTGALLAFVGSYLFIIVIYDLLFGGL